jgi:hypothetical protein
MHHEALMTEEPPFAAVRVVGWEVPGEGPALWAEVSREEYERLFGEAEDGAA